MGRPGTLREGRTGLGGGPSREPFGFESIPFIVESVIGSVLAVEGPVGDGSGVVVGEGGVAVTNAHVVGDATEVQVVLATGERVVATVVGVDTFTDLAVLRLDAEGIEPLVLAEELPAIGSLAIAIGNPLGFENTVSVGVVSGLERSIPVGSPSLVGLIQTDAAISPGNSGGALVGADGQVIGVNVAYIPPDAFGAVSLGFAIPAPVVRSVADQLLAGGPVRHPWLGVQPVPVTPDIAERLGLASPSGALVIEVVEGSPAAAAGLRRGDVVVGIGDRDVRSVGDLLSALRSVEPGATVPVDVVREGRERTVEVTLTERPRS